ncbi:MAG: ATP-binding protein [Terracidiphilus sp.]
MLDHVEQRHVPDPLVSGLLHSRVRDTTAVLVVIFAAAATLSLLANFSRQSIQAQTLRQIRRVLIFNDFGSISSPGVARIDRAVAEGLEQSPYQIELYSESLEATLFPDEVSQQKFRDWYIQKYSHRRPDVIVTVGPASLKFLIETHERSFSNIPVVYSGVTEEMVERLKPGYYFVGIRSVTQPEKTLLAALKLQPRTKHVVVVGGRGAFDQVIEAEVKSGLSRYESSLDVTYLTDLDMPSLLKRLGQLPNDTVVLHTSLMEDAAGNHFINASQSAPMIANAANAPVFVLDDGGIGNGPVGGDLISWAEEGRTAAAMARRILNGDKLRDIPGVKGNNAYIFDWRALQHWGFQERDLPPGSEVRFQVASLWERARWFWVSGIAIIIGLIVLVGYLQFSRSQLEMARRAQLELSGRLMNAQENERSRLASELHDDFSQRVALLALDLDNASELVDNAPDDAKLKLHCLMDSASELGADLHTLSHRLHSSTLEKLGLNAGLSALCREFTAKQGIKVDFTQNGIPRSIHPDAALALFRIVQEGLRNLKKHSGASKASVHLGKAGDDLHVFVADEGIGFDLKKSKQGYGLGIESMEERANLLGGRFEINSKPGRGTRIEAWIPAWPKSRTVHG